MQKTDAIIEANPGVSLDELVASRKINADQKASAEKKPGLQAQRAQLEEQYSHFQKYGQEQEDKFIREREILKKSHSSELEALRDTLKAEAVLEQKKLLKEKILTLSRFLRAAAARRQLEDDDSDLTKAFEGALLQVYGGDATAVMAAEKLIEGAEEGVPSTEGVMLGVTCKFTCHLREMLVLTNAQMPRSSRLHSTRLLSLLKKPGSMRSHKHSQRRPRPKLQRLYPTPPSLTRG
jgi:hypothetical protein